MIRISNELKKTLLAARSAEEVAVHLKEARMDDSVAGHLWDEVTNHRKDKELSPDELESVSGGADRDWETDGCAATVEAGSWCGSNDKCFTWEVTYDNMPSMTCSICNGVMEYIGGTGHYETYRCKKCGYTREIYEPDFSVD